METSRPHPAGPAVPPDVSIAQTQVGCRRGPPSSGRVSGAPRGGLVLDGRPGARTWPGWADSRSGWGAPGPRGSRIKGGQAPQSQALGGSHLEGKSYHKPGTGKMTPEDDKYLKEKKAGWGWQVAGEGRPLRGAMCEWHCDPQELQQVPRGRKEPGWEGGGSSTEGPSWPHGVGASGVGHEGDELAARESKESRCIRFRLSCRLGGVEAISWDGGNAEGGRGGQESNLGPVTVKMLAGQPSRVEADGVGRQRWGCQWRRALVRQALEVVRWVPETSAGSWSCNIKSEMVPGPAWRDTSLAVLLLLCCPRWRGRSMQVRTGGPWRLSHSQSSSGSGQGAGGSPGVSWRSPGPHSLKKYHLQLCAVW